jgi:hypothetical protein
MRTVEEQEAYDEGYEAYCFVTHYYAAGPDSVVVNPYGRGERDLWMAWQEGFSAAGDD